MPDEVAPALRDNHIMGVGVKVRPVLLCNTLRKLVTGLLLESTREKVAVMFDGIQYSSMRNGVEHVIHSLRAHMDTSDDDLFLADAVNAFNISNRTMGLGHLVDHFPSLVPMMRQMYGSNATLWLRGLDQVIEQISMQTGWQQGDVAGTFLYCATTLPFPQRNAESGFQSQWKGVRVRRRYQGQSTIQTNVRDHTVHGYRGIEVRVPTPSG